MQMSPTYPPTRGGVDLEGVDDQVVEMYRGVANEESRPAPPRGRFGEASGYPPNCAHGMNSFADRGYDLALARLLRG